MNSRPMMIDQQLVGAVEATTDKGKQNQRETWTASMVPHFFFFFNFQFSWVTQSCPTLCNPMDCGKPGFPVHHQIPEPAQTHVHWLGNDIQPSYPLLSPSPPVFNLYSIFSSESVLRIRWPKYWSFSFSINPSNEYSRLISFRMDWLDLLLSKGLSRVFSNTTVQKHQFFGTQLSL